MSDVKFAVYKAGMKGIEKDGHTMFERDVVRDLNRKSYLEAKNKTLNDSIDELVGILDESDRYETQDSPFKVRVQAMLVKYGITL